jgi:hypothetical protein
MDVMKCPFRRLLRSDRVIAPSIAGEKRPHENSRPPNDHDRTQEVREQDRQRQAYENVPPSAARTFQHGIESPNDEDEQKDYREQRITANVLGTPKAVVAIEQVTAGRILVR